MTASNNGFDSEAEANQSHDGDSKNSENNPFAGSSSPNGSGGTDAAKSSSFSSQFADSAAGESTGSHEPVSAGDPLKEFLQSFLPQDAADSATRQLRDSGVDLNHILPLGDPTLMKQIAAQVQAMFAATNGPVNWDLAKQAARQVIQKAGVKKITANQASAVCQALLTADLWLDPVTDFTSQQVSRQAWTRMDWVENTLEAWKLFSEPVAQRIAAEFTQTMETRLGMAFDFDVDDGNPEDLQSAIEEAMSGHDLSNTQFMVLPPAAVQQLLPQLSANMFAYSIGQALGVLATETLGAGDSGLPLAPASLAALLPDNIREFQTDLDIPNEEILQFVAVRECASARLFACVPWLRTDLEVAIRNYAQQISLDISAIEDAARQVDINQLEAEDLTSIDIFFGPEVFSTKPTEEQQRALDRLENLLALVEGWVEVVTAQAVAPYLPNADRLREMIRRRRVSGTAGDQMLGQLVGLQMRPRRTRGAAQIFQLLFDEAAKAPEGLDGRNPVEARDHLWSHPDLIPSISELDSPETFLTLREAWEGESTEIDDALEQLLDGTLGWAEGLEPESAAGRDDSVEGDSQLDNSNKNDLAQVDSTESSSKQDDSGQIDSGQENSAKDSSNRDDSSGSIADGDKPTREKENDK